MKPPKPRLFYASGLWFCTGYRGWRPAAAVGVTAAEALAKWMELA